MIYLECCQSTVEKLISHCWELYKPVPEHLTWGVREFFFKNIVKWEWNEIHLNIPSYSELVKESTAFVTIHLLNGWRY